MNDSQQTILSARGIGKTVRSGDSDLAILREIDLSVTAGEAVAVAGASGSGKSTLLAMFALDEDARAELRGRSVGFVFQSFQLLPSLTALENVMLPLELRRDPAAEGRAREILERVGLKDRAWHYPKHLSGGEQQRVALARAFSVRPKLLFADEPTGSLDAEAGKSVIDLVFELNRSSGTTLVMVTHDEHLAQRCGRVIRLAAGRIAGA